MFQTNNQRNLILIYWYHLKIKNFKAKGITRDTKRKVTTY